MCLHGPPPSLAYPERKSDQAAWPSIHLVSYIHLQVLGVPFLASTRASSKTLGSTKNRIPLLQGAGHVSVDEGLQSFLQHAGPLLGKDPSLWEVIGASHAKKRSGATASMI